MRKKTWRYSLLPVIVGAASLFAVLPHRGGHATVRIIDTAEGFAYAPASVQVEAGQRVAFVNASKGTHTATCQGCPWTSGDIQPAQTKLVTFKEDGAFTFACIYHPDDPGLQGALVVGQPSDTAPSSTTG